MRDLVFLSSACLLVACSSGGAEVAAPGGPTPESADGGDAAATTPPDASTKQPDSGVFTEPGGPVLISAETNVTKVTMEQSVRFVALVTHPQGLSQLVGGKLTSADGSATYGAFTADQQGAYSLDLAWTQMNQVAPITFGPGMSEIRDFRVEFFDVEGRKASKVVSIDLFCVARGGAVKGVCDQLSECTPRAGKSCDAICAGIGATCSDRCYYDSWFVASVLSDAACGNPSAFWYRTERQCSRVSSATESGSIRCCCK